MIYVIMTGRLCQFLLYSLTADMELETLSMTLNTSAFRPLEVLTTTALYKFTYLLTVSHDKITYCGTVV